MNNEHVCVPTLINIYQRTSVWSQQCFQFESGCHSTLDIIVIDRRMLDDLNVTLKFATTFPLTCLRDKQRYVHVRKCAKLRLDVSEKAKRQTWWTIAVAMCVITGKMYFHSIDEHGHSNFILFKSYPFLLVTIKLIFMYTDRQSMVTLRVFSVDFYYGQSPSLLHVFHT